MVTKHVAFAPASQKQLGSRLRSPLLRRGTMPAQPFSRFFHHTAFAKQEREEIRGNGVKNLIGSEAIHKYIMIITYTKWKRTDESSPYVNCDPPRIEPVYLIILRRRFGLAFRIKFENFFNLSLKLVFR